MSYSFLCANLHQILIGGMEKQYQWCVFDIFAPLWNPGPWPHTANLGNNSGNDVMWTLHQCTGAFKGFI